MNNNSNQTIVSYSSSVYDFIVFMRNNSPGKTNWTRRELQNIAEMMGYASIPPKVFYDTNSQSRKQNRNDYYFAELAPDSDVLDNCDVVEEKRGRPRKNPTLFAKGSTVVINTTASSS